MSEIIYNRMDVFPEKDANAKEESFSKMVLLYDADDLDFCELGYYDFKSKEWVVFGDFSLKLICWCYPPSPKGIIETSVMPTSTHRGYRD